LPWYPGTAGGDAIADILFGNANPGAKLPVSWPRSVGQVPVYYAHNTSMSPRFAERRYWDEESTPLFPFGYGLSYADFAFSNLKLSTRSLKRDGMLVASVDVWNTSSRAGDEVVQLYTHQRWGSAARPVRELKGFQRIALGPGEHKSVRFEIGAKDLAYWSSADRRWVIDNADFDLWVGDSSRATLTDSFAIVP
jgi:beta-glucosidase